MCVLRSSAVNDNLLKLFFLDPFLASKIYNNTFKNKYEGVNGVY